MDRIELFSTAVILVNIAEVAVGFYIAVLVIKALHKYLREDEPRINNESPEA